MEGISADALGAYASVRAQMRASLRESSIALTRFSAADARAVRRLDATARVFMASPRRKRAVYDRVLPGAGTRPVRVGWRSVNEAKELFRVYSSAPLPPHLPPQFRRALLCVQRLLDRLLTATLMAALQCSRRELPRRGASTLDIFLYFNSQEKSDRFANCTPHIDRGLLSAVVVPEVRGLVVSDPTDCRDRIPRPDWRDPTAGAEPLGDAVVFVNHELQELSSNRYRACVHAVESVRGQPRLSISYELRSGLE